MTTDEPRTIMVSTATGEKVHVADENDDRPNCRHSIAGMHEVTLATATKAYETGRLCRNCVPVPERFIPYMQKQEER